MISVKDQDRVMAPRAERWAGMHRISPGLAYDGGGAQPPTSRTVPASQRELVRLSLLLRPDPVADVWR